MQQDFCNQEDLKPGCYQARVDSSFREVDRELNQGIRIERSLSEMKCEVYFDSMTDAYICLSLSQLQSLTHNGGVKEKYKYSYSKSLQQCYFRRNICFYNRKSKLDKHSYQEKMHCGVFKIIGIKSDPRSVVRIEVIFNIDVFGKLNVYDNKDKINYKRWKK